jgi:hypothetical protein
VARCEKEDIVKRNMLAVLAVFAIATMASVLPAIAAEDEGPILGRQDLDFNVGILTGEGAAPQVSWVGTLQVNGASYPIAYFPKGPGMQVGGWFLFEETVRIYASLEYEFTEGVLTGFEPGRVVVKFVDSGVVSPRGWAVASGKVKRANGAADPYGVLDALSPGDWITWSGRLSSAEAAEFEGPFRIFPIG